jgi:DNA-binding PadR family transcriptional regulator
MEVSMHELTETEGKILSVLAKKGIKTYYDIYKKEKLCSSSTAWKLVKKLEKNGFIEVKKEETFRIRGRKKKHYGLTFKGLIAALRKRESWEHIDNIANLQTKLLPLIFGKWRHFKQNVDAEKLTDALKWFWLTTSSAMALGGNSEHELIEVFMNGLPGYILRLASDPEERISWLKAIHGDPELKQWMFNQESQFVVWAKMWSLSFSLIRKKKPNWNKALEELRNLPEKR